MNKKERETMERVGLPDKLGEIIGRPFEFKSSDNALTIFGMIIGMEIREGLDSKDEQVTLITNLSRSFTQNDYSKKREWLTGGPMGELAGTLTLL